MPLLSPPLTPHLSPLFSPLCLCRRRRLGSEDGVDGEPDAPPSPNLPSPSSPPAHPTLSSSSSSPSPLPSSSSFPFLPPSPIHLSPYDKSRKLTLSKSLLSASGYKGYRTVRATHGLASSSLYWELVYREGVGGGGRRGRGGCTVWGEGGCV